MFRVFMVLVCGILLSVSGVWLASKVESSGEEKKGAERRISDLLKWRWHGQAGGDAEAKDTLLRICHTLYEFEQKGRLPQEAFAFYQQRDRNWKRAFVTVDALLEAHENLKKRKDYPDLMERIGKGEIDRSLVSHVIPPKWCTELEGRLFNLRIADGPELDTEVPDKATSERWLKMARDWSQNGLISQFAYTSMQDALNPTPAPILISPGK